MVINILAAFQADNSAIFSDVNLGIMTGFALMMSVDFCPVFLNLGA